MACTEAVDVVYAFEGRRMPAPLRGSMATPARTPVSQVKRTLFLDTKMEDRAPTDDESDDPSPPPSPTHQALLREPKASKARTKPSSVYSTPLYETVGELDDARDIRPPPTAVRHLLTAQQSIPLPSVAICPPSPVKPSPFALHTPSLNNTNPFSPKPNRSVNLSTTMPPPHPRDPAAAPLAHQCSSYKQDFEEQRVVGTGSFGRVAIAKNKIDGGVYAVKKGLRPVRNMHSLNEVFALAALGSHPNIVRYYRAWIEESHLYIQMEYCEAGSVAAWLMMHGSEFSQKKLLVIARQVLCGLKHMHNKHMAHLDIKPDNIFMVPNDHGKFTYKIGDFGLTSLTDVTGRSAGEISEGDSKYLAPELLQNTQDKRQVIKADIYSLGRSLFELALGRSLQPETEREAVTLPNDRFTPEFVDLLASMMRPDPHKRPSASELLRHYLLRPRSYQQLTRRTIEAKRLARELRDAKAHYAEQSVQLVRATESTQRLESEKQSYLGFISQMIERATFTSAEPVAMESAATSSPQGK